MNSADQGYAHIATYIRGSAVAVMSTEEPHSLQPAETAPAIALLKKGARRGRYVFSLPAGHSTWEAVLSAAEPIADKLFFSDGVIHNEERLYVPTLSAFAAVWGIDPARFEAMFAHIIERDGKREFIVAGGVAASEDGSLQGGGLLPGQSWNGRFPAAQDIASTNAPVRTSTTTGTATGWCGIVVSSERARLLSTFLAFRCAKRRIASRTLPASLASRSAACKMHNVVLF